MADAAEEDLHLHVVVSRTAPPNRGGRERRVSARSRVSPGVVGHVSSFFDCVIARTGESAVREPAGRGFAHFLVEVVVLNLIWRILPLLAVLVPAVASGQSVVVHGGAGPTLVDRGYSVTAGVGFLPNPHLTLRLGFERTQLSARTRSDGRGGGSLFRGGAVTYGSAELNVSLFGRERMSPYVLAGFAAGISHPTVNESFRDRVTNDVRVVFFGGGLHLPVHDRITVFTDARIMIGGEAGETLALAPGPAGVAWRF